MLEPTFTGGPRASPRGPYTNAEPGVGRVSERPTIVGLESASDRNDHLTAAPIPTGQTESEVLWFVNLELEDETAWEGVRDGINRSTERRSTDSLTS
ncbi:MAG TPA: hypothetical protein VFQ61_26540 [Polyangiaceae bacterium]|nr:hypothetical protein [Polyangiaceae bacterium]